MVYLPSQATLAAANKKAAELKQLGIADFFILQESGPFKFAISLGVFRSEAAAQRYIQYLESRQVKNLNIVARGANNSSLQWLILPNSTASLRKEIKASHFSSTDWRNCGNAQTPDKVTSLTSSPT
jgi:hypothetical protein